MSDDLTPEDADRMCQDCFTPEEIETIRSGMKKASADAMAERRRRGHKVNPRILAWKQRLQETVSK